MGVVVVLRMDAVVKAAEATPTSNILRKVHFPKIALLFKTFTFS